MCQCFYLYLHIYTLLYKHFPLWPKSCCFCLTLSKQCGAIPYLLPSRLLHSHRTSRRPLVPPPCGLWCGSPCHHLCGKGQSVSMLKGEKFDKPATLSADSLSSLLIIYSIIIYSPILTLMLYGSRQSFPLLQFPPLLQRPSFLHLLFFLLHLPDE